MYATVMVTCMLCNASMHRDTKSDKVKAYVAHINSLANSDILVIYSDASFISEEEGIEVGLAIYSLHSHIPIKVSK